MAEEARKESMKAIPSHFEAIGPLLRLYSYAGIFPVGMDKTYSEFWVSWPRYLLILLLGLFFLCTDSVVYIAVDDDAVEEEEVGISLNFFIG